MFTEVIVRVVLIVCAILFYMAAPVIAQSTVEGKATAEKITGERVLSKDGTWSIPVASNVLGSDTAMHHKRGAERTHGAFDISAPIGSPVYGPCTEMGEVVHASKANEGGYGYNVRVKCNTGLEIWIGHLKNIWTKQGAKVANHTIIGHVGRTGTTSFNHIHITLRNHSNTDIESHFDLSLFHWSPFADPSGIEWEHTGRFVNNPDPLDHYLPVEDTAETPESLIIASAIMYVLLTSIIQMLSKDYHPVRRRFMLLATAHSLCIGFIFFAAFARTYSPSQPQEPSVESKTAHSNDYERVIDFMLKWEGWQCTHDPVRTMGGITNTTYQAWLKKQGRTYADVCSSLTKDERNTILKDLYWEPIAAEHEWPLNAAIFDAQIGSGQGMAARLLRNGNDTFEEYQEARKVFYRSMSRPQSYIKAWLRRVDELNEFVKEE